MDSLRVGCSRGGRVVASTILLWCSIITAVSASALYHPDKTHLAPRSTCSPYYEVESGDSCSSLASKCDITLAKFESYNPSANCSDLQVDTYVCCSSGSPPDLAPKPYANGTCYTYNVKADDTCAAIATTYQTTTSTIESSNNNTWGWMGCNDLFVGQAICLSSGSPPHPASVPSAECGPQVNNTVFPTDYTKWPGLNPCANLACCDIYGECGISAEFCYATQSATGAPGTAAPGTAGCISNCGTEILQSNAPDYFIHIGYFEAFNDERPCLHMVPSDIPAEYDRVHFAFGNITSDFEIDVSGQQEMFQQFIDVDASWEKIISFGGWAFSTEPDTFPIFGQAMAPANRQAFAENVANFIKSYNLGGVDFDWEYPGPALIPGVPQGSIEDGPNYLAFLQILRGLLPAGDYTISFTAPASYYFMQYFPIYNMSLTVDYIVYLTYDLHGQWDYGNHYTDTGCYGGDCLRSQVNQSETADALSMITKAGVPSSMVILGQPLYGRSFQMTEAGCWGPNCTYTGPQSGALPGPCTNTPGYIANWEIEQIINNSTYAIQQYDTQDGTVLVYDSTQWVSWMNPAYYDYRTDWVQSMNFGGVSDWAIDLNASYSGGSGGGGSGGSGEVVYIPEGIYTSSSPQVTCLPPCTFVLPPIELTTATTISIPATTMTLSEIWPESSGGSTSYITQIITTTIIIPAVTTSTVSVWNVIVSDVVPTITVTSSVVPPPITLTQSAYSKSSTTIPGIIFTFQPGAYPPQTTSGQPQPSPSIVFPLINGPPPPAQLSCSGACGTICLVDCLPKATSTTTGCIGLGCIGGGACIGPGCPTPVGEPTVVTSTEPDGSKTVFSATLIPTTTVEGGTTYVGTITVGPPPSVDTSGLTRYTTFPATLSYTTTPAASNTHDPSGHPVFPHWPECWFCPPGPPGFDFFNWAPGIYPPGGPPAGFPTPFPAVTIGPNGDPSYPESPTDEPTKTLTCTSSTVFQSCRETVYQETFIYSGASASDVTSSTSTSCTSITACSGSPTTVITTIATATTEPLVCDPTNCGTSCINGQKRALQTPPPSIPRRSARVWEDPAALNRVPVVEDAISIGYNASLSGWLSKRNIPPPGTGLWTAFYGDLKSDSATIIVDNFASDFSANTAGFIGPWSSSATNLLIQDLYGCIAVFVVSHSGVLGLHFWQGQSIANAQGFQVDVIDVLNSVLGSKGPTMFSSAVDVWIMASTLSFADGGSQAAIDSLSASSPKGPRYVQQVSSIVSVITSNLPQATPEVFSYEPQGNDAIRMFGAWGRGTVVFSADQTTDPVTGDDLPANTAAYQIILEAYTAVTRTFPYIEVQIWRQNQNEALQQINTAVQQTVGNVPDVCNGGLNDPLADYQPSDSSSDYETDISVLKEFDITDSAGNNVQTGCTFTGTYSASTAAGEPAGKLTCSGDYSVNCLVPYDNEATACGQTPIEDCGSPLGANCSPYYQLVARCTI